MIQASTVKGRARILWIQAYIGVLEDVPGYLLLQLPNNLGDILVCNIGYVLRLTKCYHKEALEGN